MEDREDIEIQETTAAASLGTAEQDVEPESQVEVNSRAPREILSDFIHRFVAFVKSRKLYPPGHSRLQLQMESFLDAAQSAFAYQKEVTLFIQPDAIVISEEPFGQETSIVAEFAPELVKRMIRYLVVQRGAEARDFEALAEIVMMEPGKLREAGGPRSYLAEKNIVKILLIEFSYDMASYVESEEDLEMVRALARYEQGAVPENHVLRRLGEMEMSSEECARLKQLLFRTEVAEQLEGLRDMIAGLPSEGKEDLQISGLLLNLVRKLITAELEIGRMDDSEAAEVITQLLDVFRQRLTSALENDEDELARREILDQVARNTMASPDALMRWLSLDSEPLQVSLGQDKAGMLRAIFSKSGSEKKQIRFGDTVMETMETMETTESPETPKKESDKQNIRPGDKIPLPEAADITKRFRKIQDEQGPRKFKLGFERMPFTHVDTLVEMLRQESDVPSRARILAEIGAFLARHSKLKTPSGESLLTSWFQREGIQLSKEELGALLASPVMCRQALEEFKEGNDHWRGALESVARTNRVSFSMALGGVMLESKVLSQKTIEDFIPLCQEELVPWLVKRLRDRTNPPSLQRMVAIALACKTPRVIPLVEDLLQDVDTNTRSVLLRFLGQFNDPKSIRVLSRHLDSPEPSTRETALHMLGRCTLPLAEDALLEVALKPHWGKGKLPDRLAALASLRWNGSERSLEPLKDLAKKWYLVLIPGGSQVRAKAKEVVLAIEVRMMTQGNTL